MTRRREFMQNLAQGGLALALLPGAAAAAWQAVAGKEALAGGDAVTARILGASRLSSIAAIGDAILPRSDTPSATDVGVVAWIDTVVADYFTETQRAGFLSGLTAVEDYAISSAGAPIAALPADLLGGVILSLDAACGSQDPNAAQRGYGQLKELIVVGYFTSKPVQRDILQVPIIPGHFDGSVPMGPRVK
jgi:gluconate 2-dehydrogenase gamma chain